MQKISLINKNIFPDYLNLHQKYHQAIRQQLETMNYQEVWCPPVSSSPCFETHVHPFRLNSPKLQNNLDLYLHTSPEFILKNYLLNNSSFSKSGIYNLNYVFRDDLPGPIHRRQFIMLEFYRLQQPVNLLIKDLCQLIINLSQKLAEQYLCLQINQFEQLTIDELFRKYLSFSILDFLDPKDLFHKITKDFKSYAPSKMLVWDDLYHLLWLNMIEPELKNHPALLIKDFPAPLGLLAKVSKDDSRISQRFEIYIQGIEIANGYAEEEHYAQNVSAIENHLLEKQNIYQYTLNPPSFLLNSLKKNTIPECYGVAMGTERLLQVLTNANSAFIDFE